MSRRATIAGVLCVLLLPAVLLYESLFGDHDFVPFDIAQFSPIATELEDDQLALVKAGQNLHPTEAVLTFVPELRFAREELEQGRLPQWNPTARFGAPMAATVVAGFNYPPNWLMLAREDPQEGLGLGAWLSFAIAGGLMFGFLRRLELCLAAALLGAIAFSISGTLVANAYFYQRLASLIWLPGTLWGVHALAHALPGRRLAPFAGLAVCLAMIVLAGFSYYSAASLIVTVVFAVVTIASSDGDPNPRPPRSLGWLAAAALLAVGLAAMQLLPMQVFFANLGVRDAVSPDSIASHGLAPGGLLGWIMPSLFGHPFHPELDPSRSVLSYALLARESWTGDDVFDPGWNFVEATIFVGTLTVPLALFAALRPRRGVEIAMVICAVLLILLSQGHSWLGWLHTAPGMSIVLPTRFIVALTGVVSILAAFGLDRLIEERRSHRQWIVGTLVGLCAFGCLCVWQVVRGMDGDEFLDALLPDIYERFSPHRPGLTLEAARAHLDPVDRPGVPQAAWESLVANSLRAGILLAVCAVWWSLAGRASRSVLGTRVWRGVAVLGVAVELGVFATPLLHGMELPFPHDSKVHAFLRTERDVAHDVGGYAAVRATTRTDKVLPFAFPPCYLGQEGIRDVNSYSFLDPHSHKAFARIWGADHMRKGDVWPFSLPDDARLHHPFLDLIGVRWLLSEEALSEVGEPAFESAGTREVAPGQAARFFVYERPSALPRAFTVPRLTVLRDESAVLDALAKDSYDPRGSAWITQQDFSDFESAHAVPQPVRGATPRAVRFVRDDVQELELGVEPGAACWLVLNDSWYPGWSVEVDGEPAPMLRANVSMRAVHVPDGDVTVTFRYTPPRFALGLAISIASLTLAMGAVCLSFRRGRSDDDARVIAPTDPEA